MNEEKRYYILDANKDVIPTTTFEEYCYFMEGCSTKRIHETYVDDSRVSTVFLGIDHSHDGTPPLFFETMVFRGPEGGLCKRYSTWDEAYAGHESVVKELQTDFDKIHMDMLAYATSVTRMGYTHWLGLFQPEFMDFMQVLKFGIEKHGKDNWLEPDGNKSSFKDMHASMQRHLEHSFVVGHDGGEKRLDHETGLDALLHLAARSLMMYTRIKRGLVHHQDLYDESAAVTPRVVVIENCYGDKILHTSHETLENS